MNKIVNHVYLSDKNTARSITDIIANKISLIISIGCEKVDTSSIESFAGHFVPMEDSTGTKCSGEKGNLFGVASKYLEDSVTFVEYPFILDQPEVLISAIFDDTQKIIAEFVSKNKNVLVHCVFGK